MYFTITPVAERFSIAWTYVARDYGGMSDEQTRQFEDRITLQDIPIVESQRPELLLSNLQLDKHIDIVLLFGYALLQIGSNASVGACTIPRVRSIRVVRLPCQRK